MVPSHLPRTFALTILLILTSCSTSGPTDAEQSFVSQMSPHHTLGLTLVDIAATRADDVRLRRLVFEMSSYHHAEMHQLETWMNEWSLLAQDEFPGHVNPETIAALRVETGRRFDLMWLETMIDHHLGALDIARGVVESNPRPSIAEMARSTETLQTREISQMRALLVEFTSNPD